MAEVRDPHPMVGVVVVNYRATRLTLACVESLVRTRWPADRLAVMVVDNSDDAELARGLAQRFPAVLHRASGGNVGFAEACDIGMRHFASVDYLALINNDATVGERWLEPLVQRLTADPELGAAVPKILFAPRFVPVRVERSGRVTSATVAGVDVLSRVIPGSGAQRRSDPERLGRHVLHVEPGSDLLVPLPDAAAAPWPVEIITDTADDGGTILEPVGPPVDVINNFGTEVLPGGFGTDRCFRCVDDGGFDAETDVFSFSGGGVLFRRAFLDDVGLFDPRLSPTTKTSIWAGGGAVAAGATAPSPARSCATSTRRPPSRDRLPSCSTTSAIACSRWLATVRSGSWPRPSWVTPGRRWDCFATTCSVVREPREPAVGPGSGCVAWRWRPRSCCSRAPSSPAGAQRLAASGADRLDCARSPSVAR